MATTVRLDLARPAVTQDDTELRLLVSGLGEQLVELSQLQAVTIGSETSPRSVARTEVRGDQSDLGRRATPKL